MLSESGPLNSGSSEDQFEVHRVLSVRGPLNSSSSED